MSDQEPDRHSARPAGTPNFIGGLLVDGKRAAAHARPEALAKGGAVLATAADTAQLRLRSEDHQRTQFDAVGAECAPQLVERTFYRRRFGKR